MMSQRQKWILWAEIFLSWLVLLVLLYYTYLEIVQAPYIGFNLSGTTGDVQLLFVDNPPVDLRVDDHIHKIGDLAFEAWRNDLRVTLFPPLAEGDLLPLEVERDGQRFSLLWPVPGFNSNEFENRVGNTWWIGYLFWLAGLLTLLVVRPLDTKRSLFAAFFFLTALWLVIGNTSRWGHGESRVIYRMALLLCAPVTLHLHWLFPRPLAKIPKWVLWAIYGVTLVASLLLWPSIFPPGWAALAFGISLIGSLALLVAHYIFQPETRPQVRLLVYALLFAIVPIVALTLLVAADAYESVWLYTLLTLPIIPGAYFYSIYRFQLGGSEFRANRVIAGYLFLILLGTALLIVSASVGVNPASAASLVLWHTAIGLTAALVTLFGFPLFQRLVERRLLAMPLPPVQLIDTYLARITTTLNEQNLVQLLKDEVLPSLLIRESALLRIGNEEAAPIYSTSGALSEGEIAALVVHLKDQPAYRVTAAPAPKPGGWVRLALALQVEGKLIGLWLLGRHDPDDLYSPGEIATLQTLARQSALALANIEQAAQLQALYQASIERQEQERMKMAHFLHDAILNQAVHLYMSLDNATLTPRVENAYTILKEQIHQMVSNLRPPSLDLGLDAALEELAGELDQRSAPEFDLQLQLPSQGVHYPPQIENHIFRIVQQACENAFRHANARLIQISGTLAPNHVEVTVEDDGSGFQLDKPLDMTHLLAHKHFGLVHMMERAEHIHADLTLESAPGQGTRVRLVWSGSDMTSDMTEHGS